MPTVHASPTDGRPTHDIVLSWGGQKWGLILDDSKGSYAIDERTTEASFSAIFARAGTKTAFGDDPILTMLEQADWSSGRGIKNYRDSETGYFDAAYMWSLTPSHILPVPQFKYATGLRTSFMFQPDRVFVWKSLAEIPYISVSFTAIAFTLTHIKLWVRSRGNPGTLV